MRKSLIIILLLSLCMTAGAKESMKRLTDRVFERAVVQLRLLASETPSDKMPYTVGENGLVCNSVSGWTSGFFPGSLWYIYEYTGDGEILDEAKEQTLKLSDIVSMRTHHDIGFQVNCSYGNAYRLTGEKRYFDLMNDAAAKLARRFSPITGCIKSWDDKRWDYPVIIDNMMNLELLMSVGNKAECDSLVRIACTHAYTTMANHFRDDNSTFHVVAYDPVGGGIVRKQTAQGFSDGSCWSRGEAWALYGYTMMYRESGKPEYLEQARKIASYTIPLLPEDGVPEWDFNAPGTAHAFTMDAQGAPDKDRYLWKEGDPVLRDASAASIMASAFVELSWYVKDKKEQRLYLDTAERIMRTLASDEYMAKEGTNGGFLLKHAAVNVHKWNETDNPVPYADYYFLEALLKYKKGKCIVD